MEYLIKADRLLKRIRECLKVALRSRRVVFVCVLLILGGGAIWFGRPTRAQATSLQTESDLAMQATLEMVLANSACPTDAEGLQGTVAVAVGFLHPELAEQTIDPSLAQAQAAAAAAFLDPSIYQAQMMSDPIESQNREEALRTLTNGLP
jgi:hypothetical protein